MKILVYGTLKKGFSNHIILEDVPFVGKAHTGEGFSLYVGRLDNGFRSLPFLVAEEGGKGVHGEIYEIPEKLLARMDSFEGHPHFYRRTEITATLEDGTKMDVSVYVFQTHDKSRYGDLFLRCKDKLKLLTDYTKDER